MFCAKSDKGELKLTVEDFLIKLFLCKLFLRLASPALIAFFTNIKNKPITISIYFKATECNVVKTSFS